MIYTTRNPHVPDHVAFDARHARRVFAFGDVHGRLDLLKEALERVDFGPSDLAFGVGDWLDRGTTTDGGDCDAFTIRDFLADRPNVRWTRGNHEDILRNACFDGGRRTREQSAGDLIRNGGLWIIDHLDDDDMPDADATAFARTLNDAPIAYTIATPGGRSIGIVHADVAAADWMAMVAALEGPDLAAREDMAHECMWNRNRIDAVTSLASQGRATDADVAATAAGVDHVFMGHTILKAPLTAGNMSWIDTGAYKSNLLTLIDVDAWCAGL